MARTAPSSTLNSRKSSVRPQTAKETPSHLTISGFNFSHVKPRLLEGGFGHDKNFLKISDGFKRLFTADKKDRKMVIPVAGY